MRSAKKKEYYFRSILLIITSCVCISIVVFNFFQFTDKEKNVKTESLQENAFLSEKLTDEKCIPVCSSRSCIKQAEMLLRTLNPSYDPCENFQNFLCDSFDEKAGPYENKSMMVDMTLVMRQKLKSIIENIEAEPGSAAEKMKIVYDSCVNLGSSELRGLEAFKQILDNVEIFNWPHLPPDFRFSDFGLSKLLAIFRAYAEIHTFVFAPESKNKDDNESEEKIIKLSFNTNTFNDTPVIQKDAAEDILKIFPIESDEIETLWNDYDNVKNSLLSFDKEFELPDCTCYENCSDIRIDCSSAENNEWAYACEMVQVYVNVTNLEQYVNTNEIAIHKCTSPYIKNIIPHLRSFSDRSVANFFALHMFWRNLDKLNFYFRRKVQKYFVYYETLEKVEKPSSKRWEFCVMWIAENMKVVLENELVKNYLTRAYIDELHEFHQSFTSAVSRTIDLQEWISLEAKEMLKQHINNLECNMISLRQLLPNDKYLNEFYEMFNATSTSFLHNTMEYMKSLMHAYTITPEPKHERHMIPRFEANADTDKDLYITLHYGLLMPPVYYPDHEKFINFNLMAPIIVHELGHNINYLLDMISKTSNTTKDIFFEKKQCIENQFSNFKFKILNENLNGTKYFDENLSDNLGYAIADKMIEDLSENEFLLPGLPYSLKQLLYMGNRQLFCEKYSRKLEINYKTKDKHAPGYYRIIATAQNSKGYSKAFNCPEGSYMNPKEKCTLFESI